MSRTFLMVAAVVCGIAACARMPGAPGGSPAVQARPDSIFVDVLNENYYDARIHAVYDGGQRRSLGTIPGNGGRVRTPLLWEPRALVFEVVFVTEGTTYVSYPVDIVPGQSVEIRVPSNIRESGFFRRVPRE